MAKRKIDLNKLKKAGQNAYLKEKKEEGRAGERSTGSVAIPIELIDVNPHQPRVHYGKEELQELASSIEEHGLMQPVIVSRLGNGRYQLIAGHRRVEAFKILGRKNIDAIERRLETGEAEEGGSLAALALVENMQRENLTPLELAMSFHSALKKGFFRNQKELAKALGKSEVFVSKILGALKLDEEVLRILSEEGEGIRDVEMLYLLGKLKDKKRQLECLRLILAGKLDRAGLKKILAEEKGSKKEVANRPRVRYSKKGIDIQGVNLQLDRKKREAFEKDLMELIAKYVKDSE